MLDLVIGEFDDGLESEIEKGDETQIKRNLKNKQNSAINDKIDHIFNELTQEIYVEQRRERRQKSPTRNVFDPLPAPPLAKGVGRGHEHVNAEGVRGRAGQEDEVKGRGNRSRQQEQERQGRQYHDRRKESCEDDDRPPPGVVQAAKQSYLHKTKTPETRSEVVLYNEGQEDRGASSEKVKVDVHNHAALGSESSGGVKRTKSPGVGRPSPPSQVPAVATKEKAVIKELREKVEGKQGKISKFSQQRGGGGNGASAIGKKEEKRKDPLGSDSGSSVAGQGRPGKPKRASSEAVRLESVAEEGRGQNRMRERRPEQRRGREERGQRSRSVGALEQERAREEEMEEQSRRLRRSKSRTGSQDQLDQWEEVVDQQQRRSRSRSKSISRSRGEILDVTASSKRQEATVRPVEGPRGGQMGGQQPFSRRQFLVQAANLQNLPAPHPPAHHTGFLSP